MRLPIYTLDNVLISLVRTECSCIIRTHIIVFLCEIMGSAGLEGSMGI